MAFNPAARQKHAWWLRTEARAQYIMFLVGIHEQLVESQDAPNPQDP